MTDITITLPEQYANDIVVSSLKASIEVLENLYRNDTIEDWASDDLTTYLSLRTVLSYYSISE